MRNMNFGVYMMLIAAIALSLQCGTEVTGSVTETGNVSGRVTEKDSGTTAAGIRIALFRKQTGIASPDEPIIPYREAYTGGKGDFSFDVDDGTYTLLATGDTMCAFVDNLVPGTTRARGMTVALQTAGTITGEISNAATVRMAGGGIVVRILGTDIVDTVDNDGRYTMENVPAGELTLVTFSTALSDFHPDYRKVTVAPDSVLDMNAYDISSTAIPIPDGVMISFDTLRQTTTISWRPVVGYEDFHEYGILRGVAGKAVHALEQIGYTADTIYEDHLTFSSVNGIRYEYAVRVNNKFGQSGSYYGIYPITAVPYQSPIDAGEDQTADIGAEVRLSGTITDPKSPVTGMAWKIGTGAWVKSDSGEGKFTAGNTLTPDTIVCVFRVTDSLGNELLDSLMVVKTMRVTDHGPLPSPLTNVAPGLTRFKGNYWYISGTGGDSYGIWSSSDLTGWKSENGTPGFANGGQLVAFDDRLLLLNLYRASDGYGRWTIPKSYWSANGIDWNELAVTPPPASSDSLITTWDSTAAADSAVYDGYYLKSGILPFHGSLYAVLSVTIFRGNSGQTLQCIIASDDGISWKFVGNAPVGDYRFEYDLFANGNDLYFISHPAGLRYMETWDWSMYRSSDNGVTWEKSGFGGPDFPSDPDDVYFVAASEGTVFVRYTEQSGDAGREMFFHDNVWNTIPDAVVGQQRYAGGISVWVEANRFFWIDPDYHVRSIRLF